MNRNQFELIYSLSKKQPWLEYKYDELISLLFEECDSIEKRELIVELLSRFVYISNDDYLKCLDALVDKITNTENISDDTTQIVALTADANADSAQYLLYGLKSKLAKAGWNNCKLVNTFGRAYRTYTDNKNKHKNIIFIDEFIGSGQTVLSRVAETRRVFENKNINDINIHVYTLAATTIGLKKIRDKNIHVETIREISRGISDHYDEKTKETKINLMLSLESILLNRISNRDIQEFSLGYGQCESLYCREEGNTPNNVFPIFWWPKLIDSTDRPHLLTRFMDDN